MPTTNNYTTLTTSLHHTFSNNKTLAVLYFFTMLLHVEYILVLISDQTLLYSTICYQ